MAAHVLPSAREAVGSPLSGQVLLWPLSGMFTWCFGWVSGRCFGEWAKTHRLALPRRQAL